MPLKHLLFAALVGMACTCSAQVATSAVPGESAHTGWAYSDSCRAFHRLWTTMDSVHSNRSGGLTVLYIGGSHVQGGWIGHEMRRLLAAWAPQAEMSRGMHLPYRLAHTNTPTHFRTEMEGLWTADCCTRGKGQARCEAAPIATGILAYPEDSASIQHVSYLPDSSRTAYTSIQLWTNAERAQWHWTGNAPLRACTPLPGNLGWQLELERAADTLAVCFVAPEKAGVWYAGINGHNASATPHITWHEWGHNGLRIRHAAAQSGWDNLLQQLQPDLIFVGIGLNDAVDGKRLNVPAYAAHYEALSSILRSSGAAVVLLGNTPAMHRSTSLAEPSASIGNWLRQHSQAHGMGCMDLTNALGGPGIVAEWIEDERMQPDGMHFTAKGYSAIANALFTAWMDAYSQAQKAPSLNSAIDAQPQQ